MLIPLKPDEINLHDLVIDVEVRRLGDDGQPDPLIGPRAQRRIRVALSTLTAGNERPDVADKIMASIYEVVDTAVRGPADA